MSKSDQPQATGRGSQINPPTRFALPYYEADLEHVEHDTEYLDSLRNPRTEYFPDASRSIVTENDSPDIGFRFSINPYRGCAHGCAYCYARPYHEYLGLNAGLDFETKVFVKEDAPELFREFLNRDKWQPEQIGLSGVTDCYQPVERHYQLTRRILEVAVEARQPMSVITKNALITRDIDLLQNLASENLVHVNVSITTLDAALARSLEPRTTTPAARLRAVKELSAAKVPVRVLVAPIIPGLTDCEIPSILEAAKEAGAMHAGYTILRLALTVAPVFREWLQRERPDHLERIEGRVRNMHGGKLNDSEFGRRMTGSGEMAEQIRNLFRLFRRRHGLDGGLPDYDCTRFRPPLPKTGQLRLF
jgi:DNA repair photolyase